MNYKTTLLLAVCLLVLVSLFLLARSRPVSPEDDLATPATPAAAATESLIEEDLGQIVRVEVVTREGENWVFERQEAEDAAPADWFLTAPAEFKCVRWEVEKFANQLGGLKYELSYVEGEPGAVTVEQAGLNPPYAVVTLVNDDGEATSMEIGALAGPRQTYARLKNADRIVVGKANLRDLIKDRVLAYREKQLWSFDAADVTRIEIKDRTADAGPVKYELIHEGGKWMFAAPVSARATATVDSMLTALSRLRVTEWIDDRQAALASYGLEPAARTVRVTVEEEVAVEADDDQPGSEAEEAADNTQDAEAEPEVRIETTVYTLHLSERSPIGEENRLYVRPGDAAAVATLLKSTADKFSVDMAEWRDMQITNAAVTNAARIDLTVPGGSATLIKDDGTWQLEADGGNAEDTAVNELLAAIDGLEAVAYVDQPLTDPAAYGFSDPQAEFRLTIPGLEGGEHIVVGDYSDEATQRLVYVSRGQTGAVAKVRTPDVETLLRPPTVYRDRVVIDVLPSRYQRITITRDNPYVGGRQTITLSRSNGTWRMTAPVEADVQQNTVDELIESLGGLRAEQVVAEAGEATAYGLHDPQIELALTYTIARGESSSEDDASDVAATDDAEPATETVRLALSAHDGNYYGKRDDRSTIYRFSEAFFRQLRAEFRETRVLDFDADQVATFTITNGELTYTFEREGDDWLYAAEPDLPLDATKIKNLLLQVRDLRAVQFVQYAPAELSTFGLNDPTHEARVVLDDGTEWVLLLGSPSDRGPKPGVFGAIRRQDAVFLLPADVPRRLTVSIPDLEAASP